MKEKIASHIHYFAVHFRLLFIKFGGIVSLLLAYKLINANYGESVFGTFALLVVFSQIFMQVADFGIPVHAMKELAKFIDCESEQSKVTDVQNEGFSTVLFNSILLIVLLLLTKDVLTAFFLPKNESAGLLVMMGVAFPLLAISALNAQILRAYGKVDIFQFITGALPAFIFLLLLAIFSWKNSSKFNLMTLYIASEFVTVLYSFLCLRRLKVRYRISFRIRRIIKTNRDSYDFMSSQFITQAFGWTTIILTSKVASPIEVGGMNIITKYLSLTNQLLNVTNNYLGPSFSSLFHKLKIRELNALVAKNTKFIVLVTMPLLIVLFAFPGFFLGFFSSEYLSLKLIFRIMLAGTAFNVLCGSCGLLMQMTDQQKKYRQILFVALLIQGIFGYLLSIFMGILGIAICACFSLVFWNMISIYTLQSKKGIISYFRIGFLFRKNQCEDF
jgi:O-antigen/teichoic acid export membrane protein